MDVCAVSTGSCNCGSRGTRLGNSALLMLIWSAFGFRLLDDSQIYSRPYAFRIRTSRFNSVARHKHMQIYQFVLSIQGLSSIDKLPPPQKKTIGSQGPCRPGNLGCMPVDSLQVHTAASRVLSFLDQLVDYTKTKCNAVAVRNTLKHHFPASPAVESTGI